MKRIKVQAPAKINISLDIVNCRKDGYHDLESIMHAISLYDYLTVTIEDGNGININLSGNSDEIPYDNSNLVWKAAEKFFMAADIADCKLSVYIEKNIPVAAGLAGGSTDAAAILFALNKLYNEILDDIKINEICASLGSDLNFCLKGGCAVCTSRGENIQSIPFLSLPVSVIKPKGLKISAKEAFQAYDAFKNKECKYSTKALIPLISKGQTDESLMHNDLELPLRYKYDDVNNMKNNIKHSFMSGSGPVFFVFADKFDMDFDSEKFIVHENLKTISDGIKIVE